MISFVPFLAQNRISQNNIAAMAALLTYRMRAAKTQLFQAGGDGFFGAGNIQ